jgi:hypothetical protein
VVVDPVSTQMYFFKLVKDEYTEVEVNRGVIKSSLLNIEIKF